MDGPTYKKIALDDVDTAYAAPSAHTSPTPTAGRVSPDHATRQSIQFAKSAFVFRDRLDDIRKKRSSAASLSEPATPAAAGLSSPPPPPPKSAVPAVTLTPTAAEEDDDDAAAAAAAGADVTGPEPKALARRLRLLRLAQGTLTAGLSLAVAALQLRAYVTFQRTKDVAGAWPTHPNLLATVLL